MKDEAVETGSEIGEGMGVVAEELKGAYHRIRERLRED